jgi:pimeloyl-ACP methyl ester carboxylesterase
MRLSWEGWLTGATVLESVPGSTAVGVDGPGTGYGEDVASKLTPLRASQVETRTATVHGRDVSYAEAGSGQLLLLIHGMAGTAENWHSVIEPLALRNAVIALDFPGHGLSAPGGGDYSLGSLASGLRDLMLTLGHERATLVGHSLGGGVALQFTYQFPEMVERLVLVSSGGLGPDVSPLLRAAALPGADLFISATAGVGQKAGSLVGRGMGMLGLRPSADVAEVTRAYASLSDPERRKAFLATLRAVVGTDGQRVAALDRLYLAEALPILIVWGDRDPIIPVAHAEEAHRVLPNSRLEVFEGVGHVPQLESPGSFIAALERFLDETEPARFDRDEWVARFKTA